MVDRTRSASHGWCCVVLVCVVPFWVASCGDTTPENCSRLRQLLDEVSAGTSAWRCTTAGLAVATDASNGNKDASCEPFVQSCVGAFPAEGKFACGPKDCAKGTACRGAGACDGSHTFSCSEFTEPCSEETCGCAFEVCNSGLQSCATGIDGDLWVTCVAFTECD